MALFLDASAHASADASEQDVEALAEAMIQAQQAISAALSAQGSSLNAEARNEILLAAAVQRDFARDAGASATVSQQSYVTAAIQAFGNAGVQAEALALAYASGASVLARSETEVNSSVHLEVVREALLLNLEARKRAAAEIQTNPIGLRTSAEVTLTQMDTRIRGATSIALLRSSVADENAAVEGRVIQIGFLNLPVLGGSVEALVEARLRTAVEAAQLWVHLDGAATASAMGSAVGTHRTETQAAAAALMEALPASVTASISAETVVRLLLILGGGADLN